jgi:tetratricopeptide (TPR) repeat protein
MSKRILRALGALSLAVMSCRIAPVATATADAELAAGMAAQEKGDHPAALRHAQKAVALAPKMTKAHFALGKIADGMCIPNAQPGPDERLCGLAIHEYKSVLEVDPSYAEASTNLAYLSYSFGKRDEAERYYRKSLALRPDDPEAACGVAALGVQRAWTDVTHERNKLSLPLKKPLIDSPSCREVRERNLTGFEESLALLTRALEVRPENMALMGFLSFLYSGRAEIQCGNRRAYEADKAAAKKWDRMEKEQLKKAQTGHVLSKCPPAPPPMSER